MCSLKPSAVHPNVPALPNNSRQLEDASTLRSPFCRLQVLRYAVGGVTLRVSDFPENSVSTFKDVRFDVIRFMRGG